MNKGRISLKGHIQKSRRSRLIVKGHVPNSSWWLPLRKAVEREMIKEFNSIYNILFLKKWQLGTSSQDGSVSRHGSPLCTTTSELQLKYGTTTTTQNWQKGGECFDGCHVGGGWFGGMGEEVRGLRSTNR